MSTEFIKAVKPEEGYGGNNANVLLGYTGQIVMNPTLNTTFPENAVDKWTEFDKGWKRVGWISEDGITEGYEDEKVDLKMWQGGATVRSIIKATTSTLKFQCGETSDIVWELFYKGMTVERGANGLRSMRIYTPGSDMRSYGMDVLDGKTYIRLIIPRGEVSERADIVYKSDEPIKYELTLTMYPDENGLMAIKHIQELTKEEQSEIYSKQKIRVPASA